MDSEKALLSCGSQSSLLILEETKNVEARGITIEYDPISALGRGTDDSSLSSLETDLCVFSFSAAQSSPSPQGTDSIQLTWCPFPANIDLHRQAGKAMPPKTAISRFIWDGREFNLRRPVEYKAYCQDGVWFYECAVFDLLSYDRIRAEARRNFNEEFAALWDNIAMADDSDLTQDAIELKNRLRGLVADVEIAASKDTLN